MPKRATGLGRGLDALIPALEVDESDKVIRIRLDEIRPNPYQPRKTFQPESIAELRQSIEEHGVIQPIIVRKSIKGYEIIAGERRYRASKEAGKDTIPAVIRSFSESEVMEIALIENLQREDLNAMEVAQAYQALMERFNLTQEELAAKVGKSRPHVANFLRLLQLPDNVREYVSRGTLSMGHARALLGLKKQKDMQQLAKRCIDEGLSVRQLEEAVKKAEAEKPGQARETKRNKTNSGKTDLQLKQFQEHLQHKLGTAVKIKKGDNKGVIEIAFFSDEDLERIAHILQEGSD